MKLELNKIYEITLNLNVHPKKNKNYYYKFIGKIEDISMRYYTKYKQDEQAYDIKIIQVTDDHTGYLKNFIYPQNPNNSIIRGVELEYISNSRLLGKKEKMVYLL